MSSSTFAVSPSAASAAASILTQMETGLNAAYQNALANPQVLIGAACKSSLLGGILAMAVNANPLAGVAVGAASTVTHYATGWVCQQLNCCPDHPAMRIAKVALPILAGLGVWGAGFFSISAGIATGLPLLSAAVLTLCYYGSEMGRQSQPPQQA